MGARHPLRELRRFRVIPRFRTGRPTGECAARPGAMPPNLNIRISNIRFRPQSSRSRASRDLCGRIPGPSEVSEIVDPRLTLLARGEERLVEDHELTAAGEIGIEADITARTTAVNEHARLDNVMGAGKSGIDDSARRGQQLELHDIEVEFFSRIILNGDASTGSRTKHIISRRQRGGGDSDPLRGDGLTGVDGDIAFLNSVVRGGRCRIARAGGAPPEPAESIVGAGAACCAGS